MYTLSSELQKVYLAIIVASLAILSFNAFAQIDATDSHVQQIMLSLEQEVNEMIAKKTDESARLKELQNELAALGEAAVPLLESKIKTEKNPRVCKVFIQAFAKIPGETVDKKLFELLHIFRLENSIISSLRSRIDSNGALTFNVPDETIELIRQKVLGKDIFTASDYAYVLMACEKNPAESPYNAIIDRFIKEVNIPVTQYEDMYVMGVSARVEVLRPFLRVIRDIGKEGWPYLIAQANQAKIEGNVEKEKWLRIGLGEAGNPDVAEFLLNIAQNDPDRYTRFVAVSAYAGSAGHAAVPALRKLLDDKTENEYSCYQPDYLIAREAHTMLVTILQNDIDNSELMKAIDTIVKKYYDSKKTLCDIGIEQHFKFIHDFDALPQAEKDSFIAATEKKFKGADGENLQKFRDELHRNDADDIMCYIAEFYIMISKAKFWECIEILNIILDKMEIESCFLNEYKVSFLNLFIMKIEQRYVFYFIDPEGYEKRYGTIGSFEIWQALQAEYLYNRNGANP